MFCRLGDWFLCCETGELLSVDDWLWLVFIPLRTYLLGGV